MRHIKNLVTVTGEYQKDGETKKQYFTMGKMFKRDDESISIKIDAIPVNFNGWVNLFDPKPKVENI